MIFNSVPYNSIYKSDKEHLGSTGSSLLKRIIGSFFFPYKAKEQQKFNYMDFIRED